MNFNIDYNYSLDTIFKIHFKEELNKNDSLVIKYRGIASIFGEKSNNQCSLKIIYRDNKKSTSNTKRSLQTTVNPDDKFYIFG